MLIQFNKNYEYKSKNWKIGAVAQVLPAFARQLEEEGIAQIINTDRPQKGLSEEDYEAIQEAKSQEFLDELKEADKRKSEIENKEKFLAGAVGETIKPKKKEKPTWKPKPRINLKG